MGPSRVSFRASVQRASLISASSFLSHSLGFSPSPSSSSSFTPPFLTVHQPRPMLNIPEEKYPVDIRRRRKNRVLLFFFVFMAAETQQGEKRKTAACLFILIYMYSTLHRHRDKRHEHKVENVRKPTGDHYNTM